MRRIAFLRAHRPEWAFLPNVDGTLIGIIRTTRTASAA